MWDGVQSVIWLYDWGNALLPSGVVVSFGVVLVCTLFTPPCLPKASGRHLLSRVLAALRQLDDVPPRKILHNVCETFDGVSSTVHQPTQAFELPVERCAIGRLVARGRWRAAEERSLVGQRPALAVVGDELCAVIPQAAPPAIGWSRAKPLLDARVWCHLGRQLGHGSAQIVGSQLSSGQQLGANPRQRIGILIPPRLLLGEKQVRRTADQDHKPGGKLDLRGVTHPRLIVAHSVGPAHDLKLAVVGVVRRTSLTSEEYAGVQLREGRIEPASIGLVRRDRDIDVAGRAGEPAHLQRDAANQDEADIVTRQGLEQRNMAGVHERAHASLSLREE